MNKEDTSHFHSSLERLSRETDPIIHFLQKAKRTEHVHGGWLIHLYLQPFGDLSKLFKVIKGLNNINLSALPVAGTIATITYSSLFTSLGIAQQMLLAFATVFILYLTILPFYFKKMLTFHDKSFHYKAYMKFRAQEFRMVSYAVENDMSLTSLYDFITGVLTKQEETSKLVKILIERFEKEKEESKKEWDEDKNLLEEAMNEMNETIESLVDEISMNEDSIRYYSELLKDINVLLYRYYNGVLGFSDLKFMSGITLYKAKGNVLYKIADEGTTGKANSIIHIDDKDYEDWALIHAYKAEDNLPRANEHREGYFIVSCKILIEETWLLNFHVDRIVNSRAWNLLLNDDILDTKETYRLFYGICLLLTKNMDAKGIDQHVSNEVTRKGS